MPPMRTVSRPTLPAAGRARAISVVRASSRPCWLRKPVSRSVRAAAESRRPELVDHAAQRRDHQPGDGEAADHEDELVGQVARGGPRRRVHEQDRAAVADGDEADGDGRVHPREEVEGVEAGPEVEERVGAERVAAEDHAQRRLQDAERGRHLHRPHRQPVRVRDEDQRPGDHHRLHRDQRRDVELRRVRQDHAEQPEAGAGQRHEAARANQRRHLATALVERDRADGRPPDFIGVRASALEYGQTHHGPFDCDPGLPAGRERRLIIGRSREDSSAGALFHPASSAGGQAPNQLSRPPSMVRTAPLKKSPAGEAR